MCVCIFSQLFFIPPAVQSFDIPARFIIMPLLGFILRYDQKYILVFM